MSLDQFILPFFQIFTTIYIYIIYLIIFFQYFFGKKDLKQVMNSFVEYLFLPTRSSFEIASAKKFISWLTVIVLSFCIIIGFPPLIDIIIQNLFSQNFSEALKTNKDLYSSWLDFSDITLTVLILITFGGLIFTDFIAQKFKDTLSGYKNKMQNLLRNNLSDLEQDIREQLEKLFTESSEVLSGFKKAAKDRHWISAIKIYMSYLGKYFSLLSSMSKLQSHLLHEIPQNYSKYLIILFYSNFPGGLYGLVIFFLFILSIIGKVFKLYLASPLLK